MKKLEECAILEYIDNGTKPVKSKIEDNSFIDWYKRGATEAQRWFNPKEELHEHKELVLAHVPLINYPLLFAYNLIESAWYHNYDGEFYLSEITPLDWRPINRI